MNLSRRKFLRGAGSLAVSLPLLEANMGRAWAQGQGPRRFLVFMTPQGMVMDAWRPTGTESNWQLSQILQPLAPFKSKVNVVSRLDNAVSYLNVRSDGHNSAARTLLTCEPFVENVDSRGNIRPQGQQVSNGFANGPSIDQVIARRIAGNTPLNTLDLAIGGREVWSGQILQAGPNDPVALNDDPRDVFNRLFSDLPAPGAGNQPPPPPPPITTADRIRARRGSVLDTVRGSFGRIQARLGATDRARLEAHAEKIRELETRFTDTPVVMEEPPPPPSQSCEQPVLPTFPARYNPASSVNDDITARVMIDEMVMAFTCDLSRVGTLQFTRFHAPTFPWLNVDVPGPFTEWHGMIHEGRSRPGPRATMVRVMTWYAEVFAYLLEQMDSIQEGNRTMLDNSLVLWVSDFGEGAFHGTVDLPFVTAGSLGGAVHTNRFISGLGRSHNDLYTAILNAFGFSDQSFGWAEFSNGPLPGLVV